MFRVVQSGAELSFMGYFGMGDCFSPVNSREGPSILVQWTVANTPSLIYFLTSTPLFRKYTQRCFADLCTKVILMPATEKYFPGPKIDYFRLVKLILSSINCRKISKLLLDILAIKSYLGSPMQVAVYRHLQDIQDGLHSAGFSSCPNTRQAGYSSLY